MADRDNVHRDLPGFLYNETTGRYVKILPNHHARVLGEAAQSASTGAATNAMVSKKRRRDEQEQNAVISDGQITRSRILQDSLVGSFLRREMGHQSQSTADIQAHNWCRAIQKCTAISVKQPSQTWYLMRKSIRNNAYLGVTHLSGRNPSQSSKFHNVLEVDGIIEHRTFDGSFSQVSSISLTETYAFLSTYSRSAPNIVVELPTESFHLNTDPAANAYGIDKATEQHDYWCTSFHPDTSKPRIAVGTETSVLVHNPFCNHGHGMTEYKRTVSSTPTLSIQWKSENVVLAGLRDSTVHLYDLRARDVVLRLRHKTSVMRMHCVSDSKILLGGPLHLDMYDLRYSKSPHKTRPSRPWLTYPRYENRRWKTHDMDVSLRLGLLAIAQQDTTEIWNLWTGANISPPGLSSDKTSDVVSFTRPDHKAHFFEEESDPVGLLLVNEMKAVEWKFGKVNRHVELN